jgi:hypothetical protein
VWQIEVLFLVAKRGINVDLIPTTITTKRRKPYLYQVTHSWSACTYIVPICLFSVLYNIPKVRSIGGHQHRTIKYLA